MKPGNLQSKFITLRKVVSNKLINKGYFSKQSDKQFFILMYHGIDKKQDTRYNQRFFSQANFEKQITDLKKHCHILTYSDFANRRFSNQKPNVLLTFDDGYANNYRYALPVLDKYNVHAVYFITGVGSLEKKILWADAMDIVSSHAKEGCRITINSNEFIFRKTDFIQPESGILLKKYIKDSKTAGYSEKEELVSQLLAIYDFTKTAGLQDYWQLMTDEEIYKTSLSKNITIGSHGFYHNNLGSLSNEDAVSEVLLSKKYLENITQKEVATIGFPDGSYTELLNDSLLKEGFANQFLVDYKTDDAGTRDFTFARYGLYPFMGNNNEILYKMLHQ